MAGVTLFDTACLETQCRICRPAALVPAGEAVRYAAWLEEGSLEALDLTAKAAGQAAWHLLRTCQPAHLQNSGLIGDLQNLATLQTLVTHFPVCLHSPICHSSLIVSIELLVVAGSKAPEHQVICCLQSRSTTFCHTMAAHLQPESRNLASSSQGS